MYGMLIRSRAAFGGYLRVSDVKDIPFLVKESEVVTGEPGRNFVVASADRLLYRVASTANGYKVERLGSDNRPMSVAYVGGGFEGHSLAEAMKAGQLFTPMVGG